MGIRTAAVVGLGAMGTMYARQFTETLGADAVKVAASGERIARYRKDGIRCNGKKCNFLYTDGSREKETGETADLVLFTVKFGGLRESMELAAPLVGKDTVILSVLNGITSEKILSSRFGREKVLLCTAQSMDPRRSGNETIYEHMGSIWFGPQTDGQEKRVRDTEDFFRRTGIEYEETEDMTLRLWRKLMLNVGVNQAAMVYETNYGGMRGSGDARDVLIAAMEEVKTVGNAEGVPLTEEDIRNWLRVIDSGLSASGLPSMRQDAIFCRPTEVELFSGTVREIGRKHHIPTPVNDMLYRMIRYMESNYRTDKETGTADVCAGREK